MTFGFIKYVLAEEARPIKLKIDPLPYSTTALAPVISKQTIDYHFEHLAKTYAKRYNAGEGDPDFNQAGVFLHNILFAQYQAPKDANNPTGKIQDFIEKHFGTFAKFKDEFAKEAMSIQGSGWVYLSDSGKIKTIKNHEIKRDIVLLIDWWEHAWALDYQWDKKEYIDNQWRIINWEHINENLK